MKLEKGLYSLYFPLLGRIVIFCLTSQFDNVFHKNFAIYRIEKKRTYIINSCEQIKQVTEQ